MRSGRPLDRVDIVSIRFPRSTGPVWQLSSPLEALPPATL